MIFSHSLPYAKQFFAPLSLRPSAILTLVRFLVACFSGLAAAAHAADSIRTDPRHRAQLVRFLARQGWSRNWNTLATLADFLLARCSTEVGTWAFILDRTYHSTTGRHAQNTFSRANRKKPSRAKSRRQQHLAVHNVGTVNVVFSTTQQPQAGQPTEVQKILPSNRDDWSAAQVVAAYAVRWQIEKDQANYSSSRRGGGGRGRPYHRRDGVARPGRVVSATPGRIPWRNRMPAPHSCSAPPRLERSRRRCPRRSCGHI